jgi:predicted amidohydrolase YtcJ
MLKRFDARKINSIDELKEKIEKYSKKLQPNSWIVGSNINLNIVLKGIDTEKEYFVDDIYNKRPLFISNYDYHSAICNSLALNQSGIKPGMFPETDVLLSKSGTPTGIIKESAYDYMFDHLPVPDINEKLSAAEDFTGTLHSYGITTVTDITLPDNFDVYKNQYNAGKLRVRINSYIPVEEFGNIERHKQYTKEINPDLFTINGFKAFYDGSLGSESALFSKNYRGKNHNGIKTETVLSGDLDKLAREIDKQDGQLIIHAIGDLAVTEVLDLYENLIKENGTKERRHRIEHAQHIIHNDLERFKQLGVIASVQPLHLKYDIDIVKEKLPDELINTTHIYKKLMDMGVVINFGTDFPVVDVNPFANIQMAITRRSGKEVFLPDCRIDLQNCLKAYTINNAYSNFNDEAIGSIQKGKCADFVIMEDDLFAMDPETISSARVWKTYFNGDEVYTMI